MSCEIPTDRLRVPRVRDYGIALEQNDTRRDDSQSNIEAAKNQA
jgi:hypothetical protein